MSSRAVTLETKCWDGDWKIVLETDWLARLAERHPFPFTHRTLVVNNVRDRAAVAVAADRACGRGLLDRVVFVEDHAAAALRAAGLTRAELGVAYVYSAAELVGLHACETEYLLHYSSDAMPQSATRWIGAALDRFEADSRVRVANLTWNGLYDQARAESLTEDEDFWFGYGFSDQCYLVRAADFRAPIYGETHAASQRYPRYAGPLFEMRVDAWMRNHGWMRATFKHGSYMHANHPAPLGCRLRAQIARLRHTLAGRTP